MNDTNDTSNTETLPSFEISMVPNTIIEMALEKESFSFGEEQSNVSISLQETYGAKDAYGEQGEFEYLEVVVDVGSDDPTLKDLDVYTQYTGLNTIKIKHGCHFIWPGAFVLYGFYPDWDQSEDRIFENPTIKKDLGWPADYMVASGLRAYSITEKCGLNGTVVVGMIKGNETSKGERSYYKAEDSMIIQVQLGGYITQETKEEGTESGFYMHSNNPLCERTYTFKDRHPIPGSVYQVWGHFCSAIPSMASGKMTSNSVNDPVWLCYAVYDPDWLKAGIVIKREEAGRSRYIYTIRTNGMPAEIIITSKVRIVYELGAFVVLQKGDDDQWYITPSSRKYWELAVDFNTYQKKNLI